MEKGQRTQEKKNLFIWFSVICAEVIKGETNFLKLTLKSEREKTNIRQLEAFRVEPFEFIVWHFMAIIYHHTRQGRKHTRTHTEQMTVV